MQESKLKNLNYGDADSLGILQQRPSTGWGTKAQVTNVVNAAMAFYGVAEHTRNPGLKQINGWENMTVTQAAQAVQRSAFPNAYAQWESVARSLVASFEQTSQALTVMSYNLLGFAALQGALDDAQHVHHAADPQRQPGHCGVPGKLLLPQGRPGSRVCCTDR